MARNIGVTIGDPQPVYRAVILKLYPGIHNRVLKTYTTGDGTEYLYHEAEAYGPYGTKAPATSQATSALRLHEQWKKNGAYLWRHEYNRATRRSERVPSGDSVPEITAFVEEQVPAWNQLAGTVRTS